MNRDPLTVMLEARSVALVGASPRSGSLGARMIGETAKSPSRPRTYLVNPRYREIGGHPCFPSLGAVPEAVDLALLAVPDAALEEQVRAAAGSGARSAVIFGSAIDARPAAGAQPPSPFPSPVAHPGTAAKARGAFEPEGETRAVADCVSGWPVSPGTPGWRCAVPGAWGSWTSRGGCARSGTPSRPLADDPAVGAVALAVDLVPEHDGDDSYRAALLAAAAKTAQPLAVLASIPAAIDPGAAARLRESGIPVLESTRTGLRALGHFLASAPAAPGRQDGCAFGVAIAVGMSRIAASWSHVPPSPHGALLRPRRRGAPSSTKGKAMDDDGDDLAMLDDSALLSRWAEMRAGLERMAPASPGYAALAASYDKSTQEVNDRARKAWSGAGQEQRR